MYNSKFTIDDIHQLRFDNYEKTKNMTPEELINNTKRQAEIGKKMIEAIRSKTRNASGR